MRTLLAGRLPLPRLFLWGGAGLFLLGLAAALANVTHDKLFHPGKLLAAQPAGEAPADPKKAQPAHPLTITLAEGKFKTVGVRLEAAKIVELPAEVVVAGTIEANPNRRVEIRPRAAGVVRSVDVSPSQKVKAGAILAMLDSADVASARLNVRAKEVDLSIARTEADWKAMIAANVEALIPELRKATPASEIEKKFADKPLGAHRGDLLSAYADLEIASHEETKQASLHEKLIVGEHPWFLAIHTRESAQAKFEASLEQVKFDVKQQNLVAGQQVFRAEAALVDAVKRLQILGVQEGPADPLTVKKPISMSELLAEDVLAYPLLAPFDGTIVSVSAVFSQRAEPTDVLFTLADLSTVRAVANIPEADFSVLPSLKDGKVRMTAAAYPERVFEAKVLYSGAMVDPSTRRMRLVAETQNPDDLLRLGMFVQIRLDSPTTERVLTVPAGAVFDMDDRSAVFVPSGKDGRTFTLRHVVKGRESAGRRVITKGLAPGDRVVSEGAFTLKSELTFQNEPQED